MRRVKNNEKKVFDEKSLSCAKLISSLGKHDDDDDDDDDDLKSKIR